MVEKVSTGLFVELGRGGCRIVRGVPNFLIQIPIGIESSIELGDVGSMLVVGRSDSFEDFLRASFEEVPIELIGCTGFKVSDKLSWSQRDKVFSIPFFQWDNQGALNPPLRKPSGR